MDAAEFVSYVRADALSGSLGLGLQYGRHVGFLIGIAEWISGAFGAFVDTVRLSELLRGLVFGFVDAEGSDHNSVVVSTRFCFLYESRKFFVL